MPWFIPTLAAIVFAGATSGWLHSLTDRAIAGYIPLFLLPWGIAALATTRCKNPPIWGIVSAAILIRCLFIGAPPWLSDDVYRYLAEGHALNAGENPFITPPNELFSISESLRLKVNHPELTTLYPPIALVWFRLIDLLGGTVVVAQGLTAACDLLTVGAIYALAGRRWALIYAVLPLGPLEAALGAHIDTLAVAFVAWAAVLVQKRPGWAGGLLMLGAGTKLLPVALIPMAALRYDWRRVCAGAAVGLGVIIVAALPVLDAGPDLFRTLQTYSQSWSFNGFGLWLTSPLPSIVVRPILATIGVAAVGWATWRSTTVHAAWLVVGTAFILVTPTAHPWYLMWVVIPALLTRQWAWIVASVPLMWSYAVLLSLRDGGTWTEQPWLLPLTWGAALLLLGLSTLRKKQQPVPKEQ